MTYHSGTKNMHLNSADRDEFATRYSDIVNELNQRKQWLTQLLSHEVLSRILSLLSGKGRGQFALTCRFWNKFILQEWHEM